MQIDLWRVNEALDIKILIKFPYYTQFIGHDNTESLKRTTKIFLKLGKTVFLRI